VLTASRATTSDGLVARVALDTPLGTQPASIGPGAAHRRRTVRRSAAGKPSPMTVVSWSIRQVPDAPATKVTRRVGGIHASMARKGLGQSKSEPFVRLDPLARMFHGNIPPNRVASPKVLHACCSGPGRRRGLFFD